MEQPYKVEMKNISKSFAGVHALRNVSITVKRGEIHALVGENGAGKSTLMKILAGALKSDGGTIKIDGEAQAVRSPVAAKALGISVIYQELMLANDLTVAENIYIDRIGKNTAGFVNWKKLKERARELLDKLGFGGINPGAKTGSLSVAYRQVVEICKSLSRKAQILVLDEPTAVLTFDEIQKLFGLLRTLQKKGVSIIYISHRLEEIFQLCERITVLKDGCVAGDYEIGGITKEELVNKMVGREISTLFPERSAEIGEIVLEAENLSVQNTVESASFNVRRGEVLGLSGLVGSGRTETMSALFGADRLTGGTIKYKGNEVRFRSPAAAVKRGVGYLSEDRKQKGILPNMSIRENVTLSAISKVSKFGIIRRKYEKKFVVGILEKLKAKYDDIDDKTSSLSGGNQQKVSLAKWLAADCDVIILDEPTRGVDVGAKIEIYNSINSLARSGVAVVMISSETTEIVNMCDRALCMRNGKAVGELSKERLNERNLISYAMGVIK